MTVDSVLALLSSLALRAFSAAFLFIPTGMLLPACRVRAQADRTSEAGFAAEGAVSG